MESPAKPGANTPVSEPFEPVSLNELVEKANALRRDLPQACALFADQIADLHDRLASGRVQLAVLGQFNRGKSSFLNALLGLDVLPVSVLPLTSVPTRIAYGPDLICTVRFTSGRSPIIESASAEAIGAVLRTYVTEEANPKNREAVATVELTCPAGILEHGTVLIDTPGFGSTFAHNTQTTIDLIVGCDAAILMLSADLPITQAEIEFLRELYRFVPRIFFVYNKVDLLDETDLRTTQQFIRTTLTANLPFLIDPHLFPVSARRALDKKDPGARQAGGLDRIKADIVDFLERDKFFTLSHGLNKKFIEAIDGMVAVLTRRRDELYGPLDAARGAIATVDRVRASFGRLRAETLKLLPAERAALRGAATRSIEGVREQCATDTLQAMVGILNASAAVSVETIRGVSSRIFSDAFERIMLQTVSAVNAALRATLADLEGRYRKQIAAVSSEADLVVPEAMAAPSFAHLDMDRPAGWTMTDPAVALAGVRTRFFDSLSGRETRVTKLTQKLAGAYNEIAAINCLRLEQALSASIDMLADTIDAACSAELEKIDGLLRSKQAEAIAVETALRSASGAELEKVEKLMVEFSKIRSHLSA